MKSMTKLMVVAMVLAAALVVAPAAARTVNSGNTIYVGEENINFATAFGTGAGVAKLVHYSDPSTGTIDKTISVSGPLELTKSAVGTTTGTTYYAFASGADPSNRLAATGTVFIEKPSVKLDVVLNKTIDARKDSVNGKTVTRDADLIFQLDTNLNGFIGVNESPTINVEVTLPGGGVTTQFQDANLRKIFINESTKFYTENFTLTGAEPGKYTAIAKWPSSADFYGKGFDSEAVNFEVLAKKLAISSNKDTVVRGNSFTVTVAGEAKKLYHLYVKPVGSLENDKYPAITAGQNGLKGVYNSTTKSFDANTFNSRDMVIETTASGTRSIQFDTNLSTSDRQFTIRVEDPLKTGTYDEVKVKIEKGEVTITASGTGVYYIGEEITLSGTNTDSDNIFLFLAGPNLGTNGVKLDDLNMDVENGNETTFTKEPVEADDTWSYKWDTSNLARMLDAGGYTVYAVAAPHSKDKLSDVKYATTSVSLKSAFITATTSGATVAKGDKLTITGTAQGAPDSVYVWIFGKNYYKLQQPATVESDGSFEYKLESGDTKDLSSGQYFVVIQHPMNGGAGVTANESGFITAQGITPVDLKLLKASEAATALVDALDSSFVDDTYTKITFVVDEPQILIDPIGDKEAGSKFTISGTTNLAVGDKLMVSVTSAAFQPSKKTETSGFDTSAGTAIVEKGDGANKWSFEVDATGFKPDQYIVKIESVETDKTATANFNVVEPKPTTQPTTVTTTQPAGTTTTATTTAPATTPTQSPGFGALVALAGLGAVAFLVLRRN